MLRLPRPAAMGDCGALKRETFTMPSFARTDPLADPAATAASVPGLAHAPATARNREPIRQALAGLLPAHPCRVLEVASGSGEHALWMARALPQVTWVPSEATAGGLANIDRWRMLCPELSGRVLPAVLLDASQPPWPGDPVDAVFVANLTHIAPWSATLGLVGGAAARLVAGGLLLIYGPFNECGGYTGDGNARFDADLRRRNPEWGLRDREAVDAVAEGSGFVVEPAQDMPANNRLLVYRHPGRDKKRHR
ncbi:DUF938 domain-containing protein [Meridianimarinicoccus roseus]|nr:DUF938 domain-containing protein [Meridianimarinicoccus roseus]